MGDDAGDAGTVSQAGAFSAPSAEHAASRPAPLSAPASRHYPRRDMRWLELRRRTFYAVMDVPRPLRALLGKKRMVRSLGTRDYYVALSRRHAALAEFQRVFAEAQGKARASPMVEVGLAYRDKLTRIDRGDPTVLGSIWADPGIVETPDDAPPPTQKEIARTVMEMGLYEHLDALRQEGRDAEANTLGGIALGLATPLLLHVDSWLAEGGSKGPLNERTKAQYRADVAALETWTKSAGVPPLIESFTRQIAGRYITEALVGRGVDRGTANRKISAPSSYWRWLVRRGHAEANPWQGQSLAKIRVGRAAEDPKRPFTDIELAALLSGPADPELSDAMRIAALSGMRVEEIYRLTVAACAGGWFDLRRGKTPAGRRRVPVHSDLTALVTKRTKGKDRAAFLFHEAGPALVGRERSMAVSKRFGRYRRRLGVHEASGDRRQSRIDFHSFRRWFVTAARNAGIDRAIVAAVVGHETGNITDDVYSGGPDDARRRACVEAVRLPTPQ